jgi:hypothetical protein
LADETSKKLTINVTAQVTGTFSSKGKVVFGIQVQFTPISAGHLAE